LLNYTVERKGAEQMRRSSCHALVTLLGVLAAGLPASRAQQASDLAPPFAVKASGKFIDVPSNEEGRIEHDNAYPWFGDFDGDGKPDLLVGQHTYGAGRKKEGSGGRLRIYRNIGEIGSPHFGEPVWFDDRVPTARIPGG
jgi:hypothetical protein